MLGVKLGDDINSDAGGIVHPRNGGMSVASAWRELPAHRIPGRLRDRCPKAAGPDSVHCWKMGEGPFSDGMIRENLALRVDHPTHGVVEPAGELSAEAFQAALEETRTAWRIDESCIMIWRRGQTDSDPLSAYTERLLRLHQLISSGEGDSDQADQLRDEMDAPWNNLNASQIRLIDGLSEDLYSADVTTPGNVAETESPSEFKQAVEDGEWEAVLEISRKMRLEPQELDILRGVCWAHLGQPKIAAEFFDRAAQRGDLRAEQEVWRLMCFVRAGRSEEVLDRSRHILSHETDPLLRFPAGLVLFNLVTQGSIDHREVIDATCRTLEIVKQLAAKDSAPLSRELLDMQRDALLNLALSYDELGDHVAANKACQEALKISPDDINAILLLGYLTCDPSGAEHHSLRGKLRRILTPSELTPLSTANI